MPSARNANRRVPAPLGGLKRLGCVALMTLISHAAAQSSASSGWQLEATPYLFASSMKGDVQAGSLPKTSIDLSFSDIMDKLDFGFMGTLEARNGRWMIFTDAIYMDVSGGATTSGVTPGGVPVSVGADATVKQTMLGVAGGYRVLEGTTALDLFAGARYNKIDVDADVNGSLFGVGGTVNRGGDKSWWDPYVGARVTHAVAQRWKLVGYADIGGFGAGSDSTWQVFAGATYQMSNSVALKVAYRIFKVDYEDGGFLYDMKNAGPVLGLGIKF